MSIPPHGTPLDEALKRLAEGDDGDSRTLRQMILELNAKIDSVAEAARDTGRAVDEILKILKRDEIEAEASDG